jgi:hypothetical protein
MLTSTATASEEATDVSPPRHKAPVSIPKAIQILVVGCHGDKM